MTKAELIERCKKVKEDAGNVIPFNAPTVAPELTSELLAIRFESIREFINGDTEFEIEFEAAKDTLESLVSYYSNYFFKGSLPKQR